MVRFGSRDLQSEAVDSGRPKGRPESPCNI
jgi:hypothetical protein